MNFNEFLTSIDDDRPPLKLSETLTSLWWDKKGDWGDLSFMYEHDALIDKIALVLENQWEEQALMFVGAGRRQAIVELFDINEEEETRKWLRD